MESRYKTFQFCFKDRRRSPDRRAVFWIFLFLLSFVLLSGCHRDPNVRKHKYLESGQRFSDQGKDREAAIQFANALKIDKNFADAHFALAKTYLHMGALSAAYGELQKTVDLQPANDKARLDLGNMFLAGGKTDNAQAQATAVLKAQPNNADAHALLSRIAAKRGQQNVALNEIHRALELAPNEAALHETLALLQAGDSTQKSSIENELKKAVALDPKSVNAKLLLSGFYVKENRLQDAERVSWTAVATDPKDLSVRENVARIVLQERDPARAEQVLRQASKDLADNPRGVQLLANYYMASGQIDKARTEFASLVKQYPKNVYVKEGYVRVLLQVRDFGTAQTVINELMKKNGKDPQVVVLNGIVLLNRGKTTEAVNALQEAANNAPRDAFIQYWLGKAALASGDSSLAERSFHLSVQLNPPGLTAQEELAYIAIQHGDMKSLFDTANQTITAAPRFPGGYIWRAMVELSHKSTDKAEADLKTAISNAPQNAQAYLMLGELRFRQKRFAEGAALLEQALQRDPNSVGAIRGLISYDLSRKQLKQALNRLNAQIAKSPGNSGFYDLLAQLQIQNKDLGQAVAAAQKAMELNPNDGEAVSLYASLQIQSGQAANAINAWEKWLNAHPNSAGGYAILGMLEESRGNTQKAEDDYRKALQIQSDQPIASNNLAYLMLENSENVDVALSLAQTARRAMPNSPNSADTLAWAYYHKGTYGFARDLLEEAIKADPHSATKQYHLGLVYAKLMDRNNAAVYLKRAIALAPGSQTAKDAQTALQKLR